MNSRTETQRKYDQKNTTRFNLKLNNKTDAEIIEFLEQQETMQGRIRELLKKEIPAVAYELRSFPYVRLDGSAMEMKRELGYVDREESVYGCPACRMNFMVDSSIRYEYCPHCGQRIEMKWIDEGETNADNT